MVSRKPGTDRGRRTAAAALGCADALAYVLIVGVVATLFSMVVGIGTGGGLVRAKEVLFLIGFGLLAYSTYRLWPSSPADLASASATDRPRRHTGSSIAESTEETRFQRFVQAAPPGRWLKRPPPEWRLTPPGKLFLGSLLVILLSYLMEAAFGIV